MKKVMLLVLLSLGLVPGFGQTLFKNLVDKYSDKEGFSAVQLTRDMFELYLKKKSIDEKDPVYDVVKNLDNILVITQTKFDEKENNLKNIQTEAFDYYKKNNFELFKTEKTPDSDLKIYINKKEGKISSLGLVNLSTKTFTLIELNGSIDLASIASVGDAFNINGLDKLRQINDERNFSLSFSGDFQEFDFPEMRLKHLNKEDIELLKGNSEKFVIDLSTGKNGENELRKKELIVKEMFDKNKRLPAIVGHMEDAEFYLDGVKTDKEKILQMDQKTIKSITIKKNGSDPDKVSIETR